MQRINQSSPLIHFRDHKVGPINWIMCKLDNPNSPPTKLSDLTDVPCLFSIYEAKASLESVALLKSSINNL